MNIVCPLCGFENMAIELPVEFDGAPRLYCCLKVIGETRCEALFTVNVIGQQLDRGVTEAELKLLPPRPQELTYYAIRTESDHAHSLWSLCERSTGRTLYRFSSEQTVDAVARVLNQERQRWLEAPREPTKAEVNLRRLADFVVTQSDYGGWGKDDGAVDNAIHMLTSRAARIELLQRAVFEHTQQTTDGVDDSAQMRTAHGLAAILLTLPDLPVTVWHAAGAYESYVGGVENKSNRVYIDAGYPWEK
jgi:hypothetical protein